MGGQKTADNINEKSAVADNLVPSTENSVVCILILKFFFNGMNYETAAYHDRLIALFEGT